jgi:hypothetical protein
MLLSVLAAAAIASSSHKVQAPSQAVQIGTVALQVPFPAGYCLPEGVNKSAFQQLAAVDNQNVSLLSLELCGGKDQRHRYLIMKTPIQAMNMTVDRTAIINEVAESTERSDAQAKLDAVPDMIGKAKTSSTGVETKVGMQNMSHSHDDVCFYFTATMTTSNATGSEVQAMTGCMTAVGGKVISLYAYEDTSDPDVPKKLMPMLRQWALSIKAVH